MEPSAVAQKRLRFFVITMVIALALNIIAAVFTLGPPAAYVFTIGLALVYLGYAIRERDPLVARLLLFGLVVGVGELPADYFGVVTTETLVYPPGEPLIWVSPLYMPLSWMILMTQFGFLGYLIGQRTSIGVATIALVLIGGSNIPLYEYLAAHAGFWHYQNTPMLFGVTPYYVIVAEALTVATLPLLATLDTRAEWRQVLLYGALQALWLNIAGRIAFALVG